MNKVEGCLSKFVYGVRTLDKTVPVRDAFPIGEGKRLRGDRGTVCCGWVGVGAPAERLCVFCLCKSVRELNRETIFTLHTTPRATPPCAGCP